MPAQIPTTFASAAASNGTGDGATGRGAGTGAGAGATADWTRPRMNGSQTFRRPSQLNANNAGHQRESSTTVQTPSSGVYLPPHMNSTIGRIAASSDNRYNRDQMLDVFKAQIEGGHKASVATFLTEGWAPGQSSSSSAGGATSAVWSRRDENKDQIPGPDVCWDETGTVKPLALSAMTEEERELFSNSVNSTLKPPQPKDGSQATGINGRKPSISQGTGSLSSRPGTRRRDTSDSFSGNPLASPGFMRGRDENPLASPPPSLLRRRTDIKDGLGAAGADRPRLDTTSDTISPFNSLRRTTTNPLSAGGIHGPGSPWAAEPQSAGGFGRMGSFGVSDQPGTPADKKSGFGSIRTESRFLRDLRGKDSNEEVSKAGSKSALPFGMDALSEETFPSSRKQARPGQRGEPGQSGEDADIQVGSSALVGDDPLDAHSDMQPFRDRMQQQREGAQGLGGGFNEPMSPTDTNPYHSPDHDRSSVARSRDDDDEASFPDAGHPKPNAFDVSDHGSRPSSTAPPRGHPGIGGFGSIGGGWSNASGPMSAQARPSAFNDPFFGSLADIGSPGGGGAFGPPSMSGGPGNFGSQRSKLGSLFPQSMQDQMRANEQRQDFFGSIGSANVPPRDTDSPAARSSRNILDDIFGTQDRAKNIPSTQSPFPVGEGVSQAPPQVQSQQLPFSSAVGTPGVNAHSQMGGASFFGHPSDNEQDLLPPAQQRTMVMPDRMRWIYRDPSGKTQGPFSGLEMHDWYKAGFFSPELQVKKLEDGDYEPLAQLIRRIGNSREPFLVPQIGIAHGSIVSLGAAPGGPGGPGIGAAASGTIQPPFAGSFPSFGTTLTADQQNALERRKQEEQYLMAQQKEFLQQKQQLMMKNPMQFGSPFNMHPGQLHHHSSAHSLQSQPSFGSMGTPASGFPSMPPGPAGPQGGVPGFFDMQRPQPGLGPVGPMHQGPQQQMREDELSGSFDRMNLNRPGHSPFGSGLGSMMQPGMAPEGHSPVNAMLHDRQRLQQEQYEANQRGQVLPQDPSQGLDRLQEFSRLRQQEEEEGPSSGMIAKSQGHSTHRPDESASSVTEDEKEDTAAFFEADEDDLNSTRPGAISMPSKDITEAKGSGLEVDVPPPQSVWAPVEKPKAPLEIPPPSLSPLPAPSAQRTNKPIDALATEDRSRSQTPSVETPSSSLAPWATQPSDAPRGPSLKEIQEAEARKAAHQEALAAEQRRQLAEQERIAAAAVPAPAPGLPSSASWANNSSSPVTPGGSAWAKPVAGKPAGSAKKTLAQIQKEEEARKNKAAAAAAAAAASSTVSTNISSAGLAGKRYAELASKTTASATPTGPMPGGAWTTVGAGGKVKSPIGPGTPGSRTVSGSVPTVASISAAKKPAAPVRATPAQTASQLATEQVAQWARAALGKGLNTGINVDEMIKSLMQFPLEVDIISDTIYSASTTLDGRRLAEEFVRRRKLADKGIPVPDSGSGGSGGSTMGGGSGFGGAGANSGVAGSGGWSEVAKKSSGGNSGAAGSSSKEEHGTAFKVVSSKKKGGKR